MLAVSYKHTYESQRVTMAQDLSQILFHSPTISPTKVIQMTSIISCSIYLNIDVGIGSALAWISDEHGNILG